MSETPRQESLERLLAAAAKKDIHGPAALARALNESDQTITNWSKRGVSRQGAVKAERMLGISSLWVLTGDSEVIQKAFVAAPAPHEAPGGSPGAQPDLVITEYATGGAMDNNGRLLLDDQPGTIKSWRVSHEWLRLNVPSHTGIRNLCIVTGFGPSMKPMFNPGDPLLVDTGVKVVNHEGVYFFRVGEEGFIKLIQRVPSFDGPGFNLRIISKNTDYPPYDLSPKNPHFEVLGKVLTVWRSEQY